MFIWRLTHYDPRRRDRRGRFRDEAWTSACDIGRVFDGRIFTAAEYLRAEDAHVEALGAFVHEAGEPELTVVDLEQWHGPQRVDLPFIAIPELHEGGRIGRGAFDSIVRLILRELIWCELRASDRLRLRFGWDYYCYIATANASGEAVMHARRRGLFVEPLAALPGVAE